MPVDIGKSIRVIRQAKGVQLKDVAAAASISSPFLTLVEKGERHPSLEVLRRIAQALEIPVEALILISQPSDLCMKTTSASAERLIASVEQLAAAEDSLRRQLKGETHEC